MSTTRHLAAAATVAALLLSGCTGSQSPGDESQAPENQIEAPAPNPGQPGSDSGGDAGGDGG